MWLCGLGQRRASAKRNKGNNDSQASVKHSRQASTALNPVKDNVILDPAALLAVLDHLPYPVSLVIRETGQVVLQNDPSVRVWGHVVGGRTLLSGLFRLADDDAMAEALRQLSESGLWKGLLRVQPVGLTSARDATAVPREGVAKPPGTGHPAIPATSTSPWPHQTEAPMPPVDAVADDVSDIRGILLPAPGSIQHLPAAIQTVPPMTALAVRQYSTAAQERPPVGGGSQCAPAARAVAAASPLCSRHAVQDCTPTPRAPDLSQPGNHYVKCSFCPESGPPVPSHPAPAPEDPPSVVAPRTTDLHTLISEAVPFSRGNSRSAPTAPSSRVVDCISSTTSAGAPPAAATAAIAVPSLRASRRKSLLSAASSPVPAASKESSNSALPRHESSIRSEVESADARAREGSGGRTPVPGASDCAERAPASFTGAVQAGSPQSEQQQALLHGLSTSAWATMLAEPRVRRLPRRTNSVHMLMRPTSAYVAQPTSPASRSAPPPEDALADQTAAQQNPMPLRASCTGLIMSDRAPPLGALGYRPPQLGPVSCAPIMAAAAASLAQAHAAGGTPEARSLGQRRFSSIADSQYGTWQQEAGAGEGAGSHEVLPSAARCHSSVAVSTVSPGTQVPLKRCGTDETHDGSINSSRTALPSTPSISAGGAMARILNITLATVGPKGSRHACAFSSTPNTTFSQLQCAPSDTSLWNSSLSRMPPGMDSKLLLLRPASTISSGAAEHAAAVVQAAGTLPPLAPGQRPEAHVEPEAALVTALHAGLHGEQVTGADSLVDSGTVAGGGAAVAVGGRVPCVNALNDACSNTSPADAHLLGSLDLRPKIYGARPGSADSETAVFRRQAFDGGCGSTAPSGTVPDGRTSTRASGEVAQSSLSRSAAFAALHLLTHSPSICGTTSSPFSAAAFDAVYSEPAEAGAAIVGPATDGAGCGLPPADCVGMEAGRLASVLPLRGGGAAGDAAGEQTPEAMVMTLTFGEGCQPRSPLLCSSSQSLEYQERLFGGGSSTAAAEEQSAVASEQAPGARVAVAEAAARGDALRSTGLGCPVVAAGLQLPATAAAPESQAQSGTDVAEPESEWHEVSLTSFLHPQLRRQVVLVVQNDVSERIWAERQLVRVVEAEHTLLENIFPHHVIEHIATTAAKGAGPSSERNTPDLAFMTSRLSAAATAAIHVDAAALGPQAHAQPDRLPAIRGSTFLHLATSHRAITVLFCDIQGFTPMCNEVRPVVVMAFLNDLFTRLDAMLDTYGVYKVETIGDCYVAAGGLMKVDEETGAVTVRSHDVDPQHAHQTVQFAKALLRAAADVRLPISGQPVRLRVGIHSGPAMSGVVGTRMPRFCLFGDTMNTASRMESTGVPGAIHVSQATRDLVPGESWEPTGGVEVKGKGKMNTFLLRPPLS